MFEDKKEILHALETNKNILGPENYSPLAIGKGCVVKQAKRGEPIGVINLLGQVFMKPIDCPFRAVDEVLKKNISRKRTLFLWICT